MENETPIVEDVQLKVAGLPWHVAHQHELAKLSFVKEYDLLLNPYRTWGDSSRPFPDKCNWVTNYKNNHYDMMIAHVDQQSIYNPDKMDRISKGRLFVEATTAFKESNPKAPIVVINHMTPFHDKYTNAETVEFIKGMVGDNLMICNSYEAQQQWGWGEVVIHGMEANEWLDLPKEPRVITVMTPAGMEKAYRRIFLHQVIRKLKELGVPHIWIGVDHKCKTFDEYRDFLGRSLVYFNPTWQSPRPRARTEAMLSGCCVVTTPYQDADTYIKDGENGFLTNKERIQDPRFMDNPDYTADLLKRLVIDEPETAIKVGQVGKKLAQDIFSFKRFEDSWIKIVEKLGLI